VFVSGVFFVAVAFLLSFHQFISFSYNFFADTNFHKTPPFKSVALNTLCLLFWHKEPLCSLFWKNVIEKAVMSNTA